MRLPALLVGIAVVIASGVAQGLWTDRWTLSSEPEVSAAKLAKVKTTLGDWDMAKEFPLDPREQANAGIAGYLVRTYFDNRTRSEVQICLVCGRPGHISVHTPDVCFAGAGYEFTGPPERKTDLGQPGSAFFMAQCTKQGSILPENYRIYWAWNAGGHWQAPDNPRLTFARYKALFKLYVIEKLPASTVAGVSDPGHKDPAVDFLGQLLPELNRSLFPDS
jgi:hypothetical protein